MPEERRMMNKYKGWIIPTACSLKSGHERNECPFLHFRDYAGHLLCEEGFRGSHQIRDWRIKLGDFNKIPQTRLSLSQFNKTINAAV